MPILTLKLANAPTSERSTALATALVKLTVDILRKDPQVTKVLIEDVAPERWSIDGRSVAALARPIFFLEVRVTHGTNTTSEKARYIAAAFVRLREILGDAHDASYVHIHEVPAEAWGYGGRTQAERRAATRGQSRADREGRRAAAGAPAAAPRR